MSLTKTRKHGTFQGFGLAATFISAHLRPLQRIRAINNGKVFPAVFKRTSIFSHLIWISHYANSSSKNIVEVVYLVMSYYFEAF